MIERKLSKLGGEVTRASLFLTRNLSNSITLERSLEKKSLDLKRKIVEERGRTLRTIASRDKDSQRGGLLGGALGLLGIGGGGGLLRRGLRRTPRSPSQLLRMQRGTSSLSRVGRLGRLARHLAAVGTGLDFIGRKAEGQTNVQAGVGAAGGLAGSIAGAKTGALIGTAIAGPLGTAVGGVGGAIIGSLAGGRIADLFTGANRRRRFEEQRTILRTQKTLFSDALDDFDKVLDKFEDVSPALVLRRDDDEPEEKKGLRRPKPKLPSPAIPFFQRPVVKTTGRVLLATALLAFLAFQLRKGKIDVKTYQRILMLVRKKPASFQKLPLEKQLRILQKELKVINKTNRKINPEDGRFFARRRVNPNKKIEREITVSIRKSASAMRNFYKESGFIDPNKLRNIVNDRTATDITDLNILFQRKKISKATYDLAKNAIESAKKETLKRIDQYDEAIIDFFTNPKNFTKTGQLIQKNLNELIKKLDIFSGKVPTDSSGIIERIEKAAGTLKGKDFQAMDDLIEFLQKGIPFKRKPFDPINRLKVDNDLQKPDSTNLALAPIGNVFIFNNQEPSDQINVMEGNNNIAIIGNTENSFTSLNKYAEFTSVAFTT